MPLGLNGMYRCAKGCLSSPLGDVWALEAIALARPSSVVIHEWIDLLIGI